MTYLFRILVLVLVAAAGALLLPVLVHLMIKFDFIDTANVPQDFLKNTFDKTYLVWMGALIPGIVSLFIKQKWRYILLLCPLVLPALFLFYYAIQQ